MARSPFDKLKSDATIQTLHSYTPAFLGFAAALIVTCALLLPLGPYAFPAQPAAQSQGDAEKVPA